MDPPNLLLLLLLMFFSTVNAQFPATYCGSTGNFTANSTYQTILTTLVSSIATTSYLSLSYGFFNVSAPVPGDSQILYIFGLCRGDWTAEDCRTCLLDIASDMRRLCPHQKEALLYSGNCIIRYSNASFFGTVATEPMYVAGVPANESDTFNAAMRKFLNSLGAEAAGGSSLKKYASRNESVGVDLVSMFMQCTPDLTEQQCSDCVENGVQTIRDCCATYAGGRVMVPSCLILWWTTYHFFDLVSQPIPPPAPAPTPPSHKLDVPPPPPGNISKSLQIVVAVVGSAILFVMVVVSVRCFIRRRRSNPLNVSSEEEVETAESLRSTLSEIRAATNSFSEGNKIREGGFGEVYQGTLENGQCIAVKRLEGCSIPGQQLFKNEFTLMATLRHANLIKLLGYCLEEGEKILVLEFAPNGSLEGFISDSNKRMLLSSERRLSIIRGIARGLLYLHMDSGLGIIHSDLKPGNVLLDENMNPKITDFAMARLFILDQGRANATQIEGTSGYMTPEYVRHGEISVKTDVYSFGVVALEIISGKKNSHFSSSGNSEHLLSYAWKNWGKRTLFRLIDPMLNGSSRSELLRCIQIALLCVQENVETRPTMAAVVLMVGSENTTLPTPTRPTYLTDASAREMSTTSSIHGSSQSSNEAQDGSTQTNPCPLLA